MEGIAVTLDALPPVSAANAAGRSTIRLDIDDFDYVDTGDPIPAGRDAVIMREQVTVDGGGAVIIDVTERLSAGRHIRSVGEDVAADAIVLPAGHLIRPVDAAALAAAGHVSVSVRRRPVVAIIPTGDEVRPIGSTLQAGQILDTNSLMLAGLAAEVGCEVDTTLITPDDPDRIAAAAAAAHRADLVLIIAGSSAGRDDHTSSVVERLGRLAVHGVAIRPGHPVILGVLGGDPVEAVGTGRPVGSAAGSARPGSPVVPVVGVPGYPASAERAFSCFALPLLRRILDTGPDLGSGHCVRARLAGPVASADHVDEYVRVRLARVVDPRTAHETIVAVPLPRGAGALSTLVQAEAILRIPACSALLAGGAAVRPVPVDGAAFGARTTIVTGLRSAATDALAELHRTDQPACAVHWVTSSAHDAVEALADGLCHAAAIALQSSGSRLDERAIAALTVRLGPLTILEVARSGDVLEVLVVPAVAFDSRPVEEFRTTLSSMAFRRRLRNCPGYAGYSSGRETWHGPPAAHEPPRPGGADCSQRETAPGVTTTGSKAATADGATRCATR